MNWLDFVQTAAVVVALGFTWHEFRARTREQRFRNYLDAISGFVDLSKLMVEHEELHALYVDSEVNWAAQNYSDLTPDEKALAIYCDSLIALCETVWVASDKRWLDKDEWKYWESWIAQLKQAPAFRWTLYWVDGDYEKEFMDALRAAKKAA